MNLIHAMILGLVEGITEFLPVSSTAHLIMTSKLLGLSQNEFQTAFEVVIQGASMFAIFFAFFHYALKHKNLWKPILVSFVPTAIVGLVLHKVIKQYFFESDSLIIISIFFLGIVFLYLENLIKKGALKLTKEIDKVTLYEALLIGVGQSFAVLPGVSRAGIVMVTMLLLGYKRKDAAVYSFLLAVPTILAASGYDLLKSKDVIFSSQTNITLLFVGSIVSLVTAYFAVKWFVVYLQTHTLTVFGIYRIVLAIILLLVLR